MAEKRGQAWNFWLKGAALAAQRAIGLLLIAATLPAAGLAFQEGACLDYEDGTGIKLEVPDTVSSAPASILISPVHRFDGRAELDVMILKGSTNVWEINVLLANLTEPFEVKWDLRETPSGRQAAPGLYRVVARAVDLTDGSSFCNETTFNLARPR